MRAFTTEETRPSDPIVRARWNWRGRRPYFRLRNFARALVSGRILDLPNDVLEALHDSRSLLAARVIDQHRHLIGDCRCIDLPHCGDDTGLEMPPAEPREQ